MAKKKAPLPSDTLKQYMSDYNISPSQLAEGIDVSSGMIRLICNGKSKLSLPISLKLAKFFGTQAQYWVNLQLECDLYDASIDGKLQKDLSKIKKAKKNPVISKPKADKPSRVRKPATRAAATSRSAQRKPKAYVTKAEVKKAKPRTILIKNKPSSSSPSSDSDKT
jgi:addiction module HigA family antidote